VTYPYEKIDDRKVLSIR